MTRILIIEDEGSYREALTFMLGKEGFDVAAAADGESGLAEYGPDAARNARDRGVPQAAGPR